MSSADLPGWQRPIRSGVRMLRRARTELRRMAGIRMAEPALVDAGRLPLPEHLIALDSAEGAALLAASEHGAYDRLVPHYVPQRNPNFCGPATIAMILNALGAGAGRRFDQDSVFTRRTEAVRGQGAIVRQGMNLATLGGYLAAHGLRVEVHQAGQSSLAEFRETAVAALGDAERYVAITYAREALGQEGRGHVSPLAAYHAESDRFLVLDVSRHKYPPVWVEAGRLFAAMNTVAGNSTRGYLVAGR
jgi:hypothetical protein